MSIENSKGTPRKFPPVVKEKIIEAAQKCRKDGLSLDETLRIIKRKGV